GNKLVSCLAPGTCYPFYEDRLQIVNEINADYHKLRAALSKIKNTSNARVYVIGYPQIISPTGDCAVNVRLDESERRFSVDVIEYLNETIRRAAISEGLFYVDISDALNGNRLCETTNSEIAVNGIAPGDDK